MKFLNLAGELSPIYAKSLLSAQQSGITLLAIKIKWTLKGCYFDKELKVDLEEW